MGTVARMNIELDRITSIFRGIDPVSLREIQQAATEVTFNQGEAIFRQGEPGDAVYIVVSGGLEVAAETSGRRYRLDDETIGA